MRRFSLLLLLAASAWGATFTSKATGNWSASGQTTWNEVGVPGNGDTVSVANTHTVTVDANTTVGASGNGIFGYIKSVTITTAGTLGTTCAVTFSSGTFEMNARGTCTLSGGGVSTVTITRGGNYTAASATPTCAFSGTGLTGAVCTVTLNTDFIPGDGVAAINLNATGVVSIATGKTLTARGGIKYTGSFSNLTDGLVLQPGSSLVWDSSLATNTPFYSYSTSATPGLRAFNATCTAQSRCTVTTAGGSGPYTLGPSGFASDGKITAAYTDFSNLGSSNMYGMHQESDNVNNSFDVQHCTFTNYGKIFNSTLLNTATYKNNYNVYSGALGNSSGGYGVFIGAFNTVTSGTRQIIGNVFDAQLNSGIDPGGGGVDLGNFTITDNYLEDGLEITGTNSARFITLARNFFHFRVVAFFSNAVWAPTNSTNDYWMLDYAQGNPHWLNLAGTYCPTFTNDVWEQPVPPSTNGTFAFTGGGNPAVACAIAIANSIALPSSTGTGAQVMISNQGNSANMTTTFNHNTWVGGHTTQTIGPILTNEPAGGNLVGLLASVKSNLTWTNALTYFKVWDWNNSVVITDVGTPANLDYNANDAAITNTSGCGSCTNQGKGYIGVWSATPGTHDITAAPLFPDTNRSIVLFDSKYLGATASAWVTSTAYSVGDFVSYTGTIYGGQPILYRCIAAHTSGASTTPGSGASWQTNWEWKAVYTLRQEIAANTQYIDASLPGCTVAAPCGPVLARVTWIRRGYTPQGAALYFAGHDGATPGAVPSDPAVAVAPVVY